MHSLQRPFRILVACKRVIDYAVRVRVRRDGSGVEKINVKHSMNPFDEIALEESLRLRDRLGSQAIKEIVAVSCGPKQCQETLRSALALGADRAIHVEHEDEASLQPVLVSRIMKKLIEDAKDIGLVIMGKQAIDDDSNQTGQILAGMLSWPQLTFASKVELGAGDSKKLLVTREIDSGSETVLAMLPAVVTTDLRLNEPRYATLQNIMKAKSKPLERQTLQSLGLEKFQSKLIVQKTIEPSTRTAGIILESVDQLVEKLKGSS